MSEEKVDEERKKAYEILEFLRGMEYRKAQKVLAILNALIKTNALISVQDEGLVKVGVS